MKAKRKWFVDALKLSCSLVRQQLLPLVGLFIVSCSLNLTVEDAMQLATPAEETQRWVMQLALGVWDLSEGVLLLLILSWGIAKVHKFRAADLMQAPFETPYLASFLAEYLRVLAQILMWGILLLVPGFVRYCKLIFVPLITVFSKSYREGEVDALRLSEKIAAGRLGSIILAIGVTMVLQIGAEFLPQMVPGLHNIPLRIAFAALSFLISVWAYSLIFLMFESVLLEEA